VHDFSKLFRLINSLNLDVLASKADAEIDHAGSINTIMNAIIDGQRESVFFIEVQGVVPVFEQLGDGLELGAANINSIRTKFMFIRVQLCLSIFFFLGITFGRGSIFVIWLFFGRWVDEFSNRFDFFKSSLFEHVFKTNMNISIRIFFLKQLL